jgi:hypothetical protein
LARHSRPSASPPHPVMGWGSGDWVFLSHQGGGRLTVFGVNQLLTRLKERAGVTGSAILTPAGTDLLRSIL